MMTTQNREWGFYGTSQRAGLDADAAWEHAMKRLVAGGLEETTAREFLDSRQGRHMADSVTHFTDTMTLEEAIAEAFARDNKDTMRWWFREQAVVGR